MAKMKIGNEMSKMIEINMERVSNAPILKKFFHNLDFE